MIPGFINFDHQLTVQEQQNKTDGAKRKSTKSDELDKSNNDANMESQYDNMRVTDILLTVTNMFCDNPNDLKDKMIFS
jgi:hypothetical protein